MLGFDPTASSLHIGHLLLIISLLHFVRNGHQVICLLGEATAAIGDPSGRTTPRNFISTNDLSSFSSSISSSINKIFSNHYKYFWKPTNQSSLDEPM